MRRRAFITPLGVSGDELALLGGRHRLPDSRPIELDATPTRGMTGQ